MIIIIGKPKIQETKDSIEERGEGKPSAICCMAGLENFSSLDKRTQDSLGSCLQLKKDRTERLPRLPDVFGHHWKFSLSLVSFLKSVLSSIHVTCICQNSSNWILTICALQWL